MISLGPLREKPAAIALFLVGRASPEAALLVDAARTGEVLIVHVELASPDVPAWTGANTPGAPGGSALAPAAGPREVYVHSDAGGAFLASTIDLVLRAHGVRSLLFAGETTTVFMDCVAQFAAARGYACLQLDAQACNTLRTRLSDSHRARTADAVDHEPVPMLAALADRIDPRHAALVLIDVQNDFCDPRGAVGWSKEPITMIATAVERIKALLAAARAAGVFIVHVRAEYGALYRNAGSPYRFPAHGEREPAVWTASAADLASGACFAPDAVEVCRPGTWGGQFVDGIVPQPGEAIITKHRFSAFVETGLDLMLRAHGIRTVVLAGVTTNCCVESTARDTAMRDFYLVIAEDCVAVKDKLADLHRASLESLRLYFGLVRPSEDLITAWCGDDPAGQLPGAAERAQASRSE